MKTIKDAAKDMLLAGLGNIDEQNDEIKDLLRRGSEVFGMAEADNEELLYNGNRERILAEREKKAEGDHTYSLGHGRSVTLDTVKDEDGKIVERSVEFEKRPDPESHEIEVEIRKE